MKSPSLIQQTCLCGRQVDIVILDDDKQQLRSLEILLGARGHKVTAFADPHAAYNHLSAAQAGLKQADAPNVLVLDYVLPGVTGKGFLKLLRQFVPHLSAAQAGLHVCDVIIVSGHLEQIDGVALKQLGAKALLAKPLDINELCRIVEIDRADR